MPLLGGGRAVWVEGGPSAITTAGKGHRPRPNWLCSTVPLPVQLAAASGSVNFRTINWGMKMIRQLAIVSLLLATTPALALAQQPDRPPTADTKKDPGRKICKTIQKTGSRLGGQRICMTAQEWEEQRRVAREITREGQASTPY